MDDFEEFGNMVFLSKEAEEKWEETDPLMKKQIKSLIEMRCLKEMLKITTKAGKP